MTFDCELVPLAMLEIMKNDRGCFDLRLERVLCGPPVGLDLPRFRGEVRSWDQRIWFDGILSSSFE